MFIKRKQNLQHNIPTPKDTLVIIGNGFDIWQGLDTSYSRFEEYYHSHLDEILRKLRIKKHTLYDENGSPVLDKCGKPITFSDVELFYGNPFEPDRLPHSFWNTFESSLDKLDDQRLNLYFGKDKEGLKGIRTSSGNAQRILRKAFCDWIATINIDEKDSGYCFGDNCLFINFNYTDTLIKRFKVKACNEYHIHGEAADQESIIFGHATHPEYPMPKLYQFGGRLRGLYFVEEALYETDKHVDDNYVDLCMFLALHGTMINEIKNVYVLGHSFGPADMGYFKHMINAMQGVDEDPEEGITQKEREYLDNMDFESMLNLNIQYAIHHRERSLGIKPISYPDLERVDSMIYEELEDPYYHMSVEEQFRLEAAAVHRRFLAEQAERNEQKDKEFLKMLRRAYNKGKIFSHERHIKENSDADIPQQLVKTSDVQWHISYYNDDDKIRIQDAMKKLNFRNYKLYPTIDECLAPYRRTQN